MIGKRAGLCCWVWGYLFLQRLAFSKVFLSRPRGDFTDYCLYIFSAGTQCSSAANIQEHRGLAQRGYNGIFYGLVTRWVTDPWVYVCCASKGLIFIFVII